MKRNVIMMAFLALFCLGATAQTLPEGAYRQTEEYRSVRMNPLGNSAWKVIVEWPGVFTGCGIRCYS